MLAKERQDRILALLNKDGAVTTGKLIETFNVSIETIRRDMLNMEQAGLLTRVHGGAVKKGSMREFPDLDMRNKENSGKKQNLSSKAAEFISDGDIIGIGDGSTAIILAEELKTGFSNLTVITNSLDVFNILEGHEKFTLILCGGHFLKSENAFYGPLTLKMLENLHIQKSFIFPSAISLEHGIGDFEESLYPIQKHMMKNSDEVFILADSSKFEKTALIKLDDMQESYRYVTDCELGEELINLYLENNIKIHTGNK